MTTPCAFLLALLPHVPQESGSPQASVQAPVPTIAFEDGLWFDGEEFLAGTRYSVAGVFQKEAPVRVDMTVDLDGQWVVPPYGEAHTHIIEPDLADEYNAFFLRRGVFYARDLANAISIRRSLEQVFNRPDTLEFISPNQGFTGPGGHPLQVVAAMQHVIGALPKEWGPDELQGEAIFVVESEADLESAWPEFLAGRPDFVKVFLLYSEVHAERHADPSYVHRRGMDPALLPWVVEHAHAAGLEVAAHIYTRGDFRTAVDAGVDLIAHFPGIGYEQELSDAHYLLTEEDARVAAERGVVVCTTLSDAAGLPGKITAGTRAYFDKIIVPNLDQLLTAGVRIVIGADRVRLTSDVEAMALVQLELFDPLTVLRLWCEDTPRHIFPKRKIGRLAPGYEASFLVLEGDPLEDFANTQRIGLRVKQGRLLFPREPEFPPLQR